MGAVLLSLLIAGAAGVAGVSAGRARAFKAGWFERSTETQASRGARRPTHGGAVLAIACLAGPALSGFDAVPSRRVGVALLVAAVAAVVVEPRRRNAWFVLGHRVLVGAAAALAAPAPHLTGSGPTDRLALALLVVVVAVGLGHLEQSDGTALAVLAAGGVGGMLVLGPSPSAAALAAALLGAAVGVGVHAAPPGLVRLGSTGTAAGAAALVGVAAAVGDRAAHAGGPVAALLLLVPGVAALVPALDRRVDARGWPSAIVLGATTLVVVAVAWAIGEDHLPPAAAAAVAVVLLVAVPLARLPRVGDGRPARGRRVLVAGGLVGAGLVGAAGLVVSLQIRDDLLAGRDQVEAGLDVARRGEVEEAAARFERGAARFDEAGEVLDSPLGWVARAVPVLGANLRAAADVAQVGAELTDVGVAVAGRAGGDDLVVVDGRLPLDQLDGLAVDLLHAQDVLLGATDRLEVPSPLWLPTVTTSVGDLVERLDETATSLTSVAEAARLAPQLLGADGPRRWFVGIMTPAESRAAGGLIGDYGIVLADGGAVSLERIEGISRLNQAVDQTALAPLLPSPYATTYRSFAVSRFLQNATASPDVPTAAEAILAAQSLTGEPPVEGVILLDPVAIAGLLEVTGRIRVDSWPDPITARNAEQILLVDQYLTLDPETLDRFQQDVVEAVVDELTSGAGASPAVLADALGPAVRGGHLRFYSRDADEEALFRSIGADGALPAGDGGDVLLVANQNGTEAKIDTFLERSVAYELEHDPATGAVSGTITVELRNTAPDGGLASYVIGGEQPNIGGPGVNRTLLSIYTALPVLRARDAAGVELPVARGPDGPLVVTSYLAVIPPGGSTTVVFDVEGTLAPGPYRIRLGHQPLPRPDPVSVAVTDGDGRRVVVDEADPDVAFLDVPGAQAGG